MFLRGFGRATNNGRQLVMALGISFATGATGCAASTSDDEPPPALESMTTQYLVSETEELGCEDGAVEQCVITLTLGNGSKWCSDGERVCVDGEWQECHSPSFDEDGFVPGED